MKFIDKVLRYWRVTVAINSMPKNVNAVFDIGCDDGYLLKRLDQKIRLDGCDPRLVISTVSLNSELLQGFFPSVMISATTPRTYEVIFALAVFEHFSEVDLIKSSCKIAQMLTDNGRLIVTIPHPFVDKILKILKYFRLIDGQALEEHHGFNPELLIDILSMHLKLISKKTFQLGLNNIFVFEKF